MVLGGKNSSTGNCTWRKMAQGSSSPPPALPKDEGEAQTVLHIAAMEFGIRPFFMGKGSNLLVSDAGADLLASGKSWPAG